MKDTTGTSPWEHKKIVFLILLVAIGVCSYLVYTNQNLKHQIEGNNVTITNSVEATPTPVSKTVSEMKTAQEKIKGDMRYIVGSPYLEGIEWQYSSGGDGTWLNDEYTADLNKTLPALLPEIFLPKTERFPTATLFLDTRYNSYHWANQRQDYENKFFLVGLVDTSRIPQLNLKTMSTYKMPLLCSKDKSLLARNKFGHLVVFNWRPSCPGVNGFDDHPEVNAKIFVQHSNKYGDVTTNMVEVILVFPSYLELAGEGFIGDYSYREVTKSSVPYQKYYSYTESYLNSAFKLIDSFDANKKSSQTGT
ncbi:MAG TPA: hypothetical protein PK639_00380 [Candidatus Woesebacteria bacterium]|nr:hypothetical protein [Candidatus Woesebacteria bacterium]